MKKKLKNKLSLRKETLSILGNNEMIVIKGGGTFACPSNGCVTQTCTQDLGCSVTCINCN